jgi:hypothetical protein
VFSVDRVVRKSGLTLEWRGSSDNRLPSNEAAYDDRPRRKW